MHNKPHFSEETESKSDSIHGSNDSVEETYKRKVRATLTPDWEKIGLDKRVKSIFQRVLNEHEEGISDRLSAEYDQPIQHFLTGSSYEGAWNAIGFTGYGTYFFSHGAIYSGNFKNGQFHGKGVITYPVGHRLKCIHKNGKLINQLFIFEDGLEVHDPNNYCQMPDRRFQVEFNTTLRGAGKEFLTNRQPTIDIPDGCYDTIDGFYVPSVKCIYKYDEESLAKGTDPHHKRRTDTLKRTALVQESIFIERNYRKSNIGNVGYRPDLYECWVTGRKHEIEKAITELNLTDKGLRNRDSLESGDSSSENTKVEIEFEELKTTY